MGKPPPGYWNPGASHPVLEPRCKPSGTGTQVQAIRYWNPGASHPVLENRCKPSGTGNQVEAIRYWKFRYIILLVCGYACAYGGAAQLEVGHLTVSVNMILIIIIIIEGLSLLQSIPPTTADKQTQAQKKMILIY